MIIQSTSNRFSADSQTTVRLMLTLLDGREEESIYRPLEGKKGLNPLCHTGRKESFLEFGASLLLSHGQGHGSESIDHNGASEHPLESGTAASPWKKMSGKKPRLGA